MIEAATRKQNSKPYAFKVAVIVLKCAAPIFIEPFFFGTVSDFPALIEITKLIGCENEF